MPVDKNTVKRVAHLARIAVSDAEAETLQADLNAILGFVEKLDEVDITDIEPMTSAIGMSMKMRADMVTDGDQATKIVANAPAGSDHFFVVPKVVE